MTRVNLLPWREELRRHRRKEFALWTVLGVAATVLIMVAIHQWITAAIEGQRRRNAFLENEIAALERQIAEIRELEEKKRRLLGKMAIIEELQVSRPMIVHLFDEIARTVPDGVRLEDLSQVGRDLTVNGRAQSNAQVSAYLRNLESSPWFASPSLQVIENRGGSAGGRGLRFTLVMKLGEGPGPSAPSGANLDRAAGLPTPRTGPRGVSQ
ncbi:MAG TPA: PilN domain-containing protein [Methylococcus sp.]|nr:PilN domain-containing protein [Methylococcus sp.]